MLGIMVKVSQDRIGAMVIARADDGRVAYVQEDWAQEEHWQYLTPREDGIVSVDDAKEEIAAGWDVTCELDRELAEVMRWSAQL